LNKLHTLYKNILDFAGFTVADDGNMFVSLNGREFPADIDGKLLKFPYDASLKNFDSTKEIIFHPLQEFINRGESDVVRKLRRVVNVRLNLSTLSMLDGLMEILSTPALHAKMNPQQRELIKSVGEVDEVFRGKFMAASTAAFAETPDALFVNIYTKKSGTFQGERHARVGVVSFPASTDVPAGFQKFKEKDWKKVVQLLDFIFPGQADGEAYNSYSDSTDCPWLDCLLRTSINIAGRLNELWSLYGKFINNENVIDFNLEWVDEFDNLDSYKKEIMMIPSQRGNEGEPDTKPAPVKQSVPMVTATALNPAPVPAPVQEQQFVERRHPVQSTQTTPIYGDAVQPLQPQYPGYGPGQMQAPVPVKHNADGKVSFDSLVQSSPMTAMPQAFSSPITQQQQQMYQMAQQAAMMNSPSMAAMVGMAPNMMPGMYPNMGMPVDPWGRPVGMQQTMMQPMMNQQMQYDAYGRPIMPGIQGV